VLLSLCYCRMELIIPSCIRGYHVYGGVWTASKANSYFANMKSVTLWIHRFINPRWIDTQLLAGITVGNLLQSITFYKNNMDFNIVNWAKCNIKILAIKTRYTVIEKRVSNLPILHQKWLHKVLWPYTEVLNMCCAMCSINCCTRECTIP